MSSVNLANPALTAHRSSISSVTEIDFNTQIAVENDILENSQTWVRDLTIGTPFRPSGGGYNHLGFIEGAGSGKPVLHIGARKDYSGSQVKLTPSARCTRVEFEIQVFEKSTFVTFYDGGNELDRIVLTPHSSTYYEPVDYTSESGFTDILITSESWNWIHKMTFTA